MIHCVSGIETNYASRLKPFIRDDFIKHDFRILEKLLGLLSDSFVIENLGVCAVWILSTNLPALEKWIPINEWNKFFQIILLKHVCAKYLGLNNVDLLPVSLEFLGAGLGKGDEIFLLLRLKILASHFFIFILDILNVLILVHGV